MPPQVAVASKDLAAGTVIRFDVGMGEKVSFQVGSLIEAARTDGTFVGRLFHVEDFVYGERSRLAEALSALAAFKWFLFRMNIPVN